MKIRLVLLSCVLTMAAFAADVSGKYTYEMQGRNGTQTSTITLKADGANLTGTVSGRGGDTEISDGKVDGDNVSFTVVREMQGNKMSMKYKGKVSGDEIKFKMEIEGSDRPAREFTAKRASAT